jgi:branched-chain amino acid transport system permease protein
VATATKAWLLYLGLLFVLMVLYVPGGFASILLLNLRRAKYGEFQRLIPYYLALAGTGLVFIAGLVGLVEMIYHFSFEAGANSEMSLAGVAVNLKSPMAWSMVVGLLALGAGLYARAWANVRREWDDGERNIELKLNP